MNKKHVHIPIRVQGISNGDYEYDFDVDPKDIGLPEQFSSPMHVRAEVEKSSDQSVIAVIVNATGTYPCDRCLEELTVPVHQKFSLLYVHEDETAQIVPQDEEARDVDPAEPIIDIGPDVADVVLVNVPMRKVCEEYNPGNDHCEELVRERAEKEKEKGEDSRWSALKNLKFDD